MIKTLFATKQGMTQTWDQNGNRLPITIISTMPHTVTQIKSAKKDGYNAIQLGFGNKRKVKITKPGSGHLKKAGIKTNFNYLKEIKVKPDHQLKVGSKLTAMQIFKPGDIVKVSGYSIGKGFAGVIKRWGFAGGPKTHGQSDRARAPGSIGQGTDPGRVWKGKKMAGRLGNTRHTVSNLKVVKVKEDGQIWIKGTVPGHIGSQLTLTKTGHDKTALNLKKSQSTPKDAGRSSEKLSPDKIKNNSKPPQDLTDQSN